ncbi:MAG: VanZ family protein, partial [Planctomycetota bacterium]|nr:VanZ family protein [Planctomycetota bacterium]
PEDHRVSGLLSRLAAWIQLPRGRQLMRRLLVIDVVVVLVLTLWPRLEVPIPIKRPDLIAHLGVFGSLTLVVIAAGFFGNALSTRNILLAALCTGLFASIDEALQSIPAIHRTCALDDAMANLLGVSLGAAIAWGWQRLTRPGTN